MKQIAQVVGGVVIAVAVILGLTYGYIYLYRDAAPRMQAAERQVYEQTPSYIQGKITFLTRLRLDYKQADNEQHRHALGETILSEAATVDNTKLPSDLQQFISEVKTAMTRK